MLVANQQQKNQFYHYYLNFSDTNFDAQRRYPRI